MTTRFPATREMVLEWVATRPLPIRLGFVHHAAIVVHEDGVFRVRELVLDPAVEAAHPNPDYLRYADSRNPLLEPGRTLYEARSRELLVAMMSSVHPWPREW